MTTVDPVSLLKGYSPPPKAGFVTIYAKDDGSLWQRDGDGAEVPVGAGDGSGIPQGGPATLPLDMDGNAITNLAEPADPNDAARLADLVTLLDLGAVLGGSNDAGTQQIKNLAEPTDPTDAAQLQQVLDAYALMNDLAGGEGFTLPTSNPGAGLFWNDGGTVKVGT